MEEAMEITTLDHLVLTKEGRSSDNRQDEKVKGSNLLGQTRILMELVETRQINLSCKTMRGKPIYILTKLITTSTITNKSKITSQCLIIRHL